MVGSKRLFCFGYGYTAAFFGAAAQQQLGWGLSGTTRDIEKRSALRSRGIDAYVFDHDKPLGDPFAMLDGVTHVLISTPPDQEGDLVARLHGEDILRLPDLEWIGYLSTTSVYGDRDGAWVDETTELRPSSIRGSRRLRAESDWISLCQSRNVPLHIFRMAGVYGPGRSALDSVRAGIARRIFKPGHAFSRIHIEDVIQTLMASILLPKGSTVYNLADDEPAPSHEVIAYACRLLGRDPPPLVPFEDANLAPITHSFYSDSKRIKNDRIKEELGILLKYPDYRAGLEACLKIENEYAARNETPPWVYLNPHEERVLGS